jgi:riboflavin kinase/FMN adenylyltransferase
MRAKARALEALGVDAMIVQRFNRDFSQQPAEAFVQNVLADGFGANHVVAGYDFVFGHKRGGNCELLLSMGKKLGFGFTAVSAINDGEGVVYSSTRIRRCLGDGDVRGASAILGRHFSYEGRVSHGDQRGRTIGFPTLNLHLGSTVRPALGVYAVRVGILEGGETVWHDGVANVGKRPTFGGEDVILEAHLMDFSGDLYGKLIAVTLIDFIRAEKKFDGLEALRAQIAADTKTAQNILAEAPA